MDLGEGLGSVFAFTGQGREFALGTEESVLLTFGDGLLAHLGGESWHYWVTHPERGAMKRTDWAARWRVRLRWLHGCVSCGSRAAPSVLDFPC